MRIDCVNSDVYLAVVAVGIGYSESKWALWSFRGKCNNQWKHFWKRNDKLKRRCIIYYNNKFNALHTNIFDVRDSACWNWSPIAW